jgi:hypothetical protein
MELDPETAAAYVADALEKMAIVARRFDREQLNTRPFGDQTNSIAALVVHSTEVCEFWLGHVALGEPSTRDRDAEFRFEGDLVELEARISAASAAAAGYLRRLADGKGQPSELRAFADLGPGDTSLVLHVLEELYQHLGHMEITADALDARSS